MINSEFVSSKKSLFSGAELVEVECATDIEKLTLKVRTEHDEASSQVNLGLLVDANLAETLSSLDISEVLDTNILKVIARTVQYKEPPYTNETLESDVLDAIDNNMEHDHGILISIEPLENNTATETDDVSSTMMPSVSPIPEDKVFPFGKTPHSRIAHYCMTFCREQKKREMEFAFSRREVACLIYFYETQLHPTMQQGFGTQEIISWLSEMMGFQTDNSPILIDIDITALPILLELLAMAHEPQAHSTPRDENSIFVDIDYDEELGRFKDMEIVGKTLAKMRIELLRNFGLNESMPSVDILSIVD